MFPHVLKWWVFGPLFVSKALQLTTYFICPSCLLALILYKSSSCSYTTFWGIFFCLFGSSFTERELPISATCQGPHFLFCSPVVCLSECLPIYVHLASAYWAALCGPSFSSKRRSLNLFPNSLSSHSSWRWRLRPPSSFCSFALRFWKEGWRIWVCMFLLFCCSCWSVKCP